MLKFKKYRVLVMGGCCGTNPDYINQLTNALAAEKNKNTASDGQKLLADGDSADEGDDYDAVGLNPDKGCRKIRYGICSASKMTELNKVRVIGERLNPTGKPRFAQALMEHDMDYISRMAIEQEESGAEILDVNVGVPGADEVSLMIETVKAIQGIVSLPLQIDSSNPAAPTLCKRLKCFISQSTVSKNDTLKN